jgi:hypothetical protein
MVFCNLPTSFNRVQRAYHVEKNLIARWQTTGDTPGPTVAVYAHLLFSLVFVGAQWSVISESLWFSGPEKPRMLSESKSGH